MRLSLAIRYFALFSIAIVACMGCSRSRSAVDIDGLISRLASGDLLFRKGTGVVGNIVTSVDADGSYSHVGIVVESEGEWYVVHAVPHEHDFDGDFDRVKMEPVENFLGRYPSGDFGHYRPRVSEEQLNIATKNALRLSQMKVRFDHDYDLTDTTRLYCTEFVEYVYGLAGVSLSEGRRTEITFPTLSGAHIMPSDLTKSSLLEPIY